MFQKIFKDTLFGRFIKALLSETALPIYKSVSNGDKIIVNHFYYYSKYIIKCTATGILGIDAQFINVKLYDEEDNLQTYRYLSYANYYDPQTHYQLGNYLRYYKSKTGINLFPFYNCYCNHSIPDVELEKEGSNIIAKSVITQTAKVIGFPVLLNKRYTIAVESDSEVLLRCIVRNSSGFITDNKIDTTISGSFDLSTTGKIYSRTSFSQPFDFLLDTSYEDAQGIPQEREEWFTQEKNLWLIIQLPKDNESSIVVYEDCLLDSSNVNDVHCDVNSVYVTGTLNPALTFINTHESYAFSDRLIEYLLNNVINSDTNQTPNFGKVQKALIRRDTTLDTTAKASAINRVKNIWHDSIRNEVYELCKEHSKTNFMLDQDGNINKDVEHDILTEKGENY